MKTQMKKRIVSILLAATLAVPQVYLPAKAAPAEVIDTDYENEPESEISEEGVSSDDDVTSEELSEENAILEESTENATVFDRGNGKRTVVFHNASRSVALKGSMVLYAGKHDTKKSKSLATNINSKIKNTSLFYNRGIKKRKDLAVLNGTKMPAVLTETGYISHYNDLLIITKDRNKIANAIVNGIKAYF